MNNFYSWEPPICREGDTVLARMHQGPIRRARVQFIETRYDNNGVARHSYGVRFDGHRRWQWLSAAKLSQWRKPMPKALDRMIEEHRHLSDLYRFFTSMMGGNTDQQSEIRQNAKDLHERLRLIEQAIFNGQAMIDPDEIAAWVAAEPGREAVQKPDGSWSLSYQFVPPAFAPEIPRDHDRGMHVLSIKDPHPLDGELTAECLCGWHASIRFSEVSTYADLRDEANRLFSEHCEEILGEAGLVISKEHQDE